MKLSIFLHPYLSLSQIRFPCDGDDYLHRNRDENLYRSSQNESKYSYQSFSWISALSLIHHITNDINLSCFSYLYQIQGDDDLLIYKALISISKGMKIKEGR